MGLNSCTLSEADKYATVLDLIRNGELCGHIIGPKGSQTALPKSLKRSQHVS